MRNSIINIWNTLITPTLVLTREIQGGRIYWIGLSQRETKASVGLNVSFMGWPLSSTIFSSFPFASQIIASQTHQKNPSPCGPPWETQFQDILLPSSQEPEFTYGYSSRRMGIPFWDVQGKSLAMWEAPAIARAASLLDSSPKVLPSQQKTSTLTLFVKPKTRINPNVHQ